MARLRTIVGESLRSLGANMSTTLAATVTVAASVVDTFAASERQDSAAMTLNRFTTRSRRDARRG